MKNTSCFLAIMLIILFSVESNFAGDSITYAGGYTELKFHVKEFGEEKSQSISSGFLFFGGKYIEPPYVVTRHGLSVYVNGYMVFIPPPPYYPYPFPPPPKRLPAVPKGITKDSDADSVDRYVMGTVKFYFPEGKDRVADADKKAKQILQRIKLLPCVKEAVLEENNEGIFITLYNGDEITPIFTPSTFYSRVMQAWKQIPPAERKKNDLQRYHDVYAECVDILKKNGVLIGIRHFLPVKSKGILPIKLYEFVAILNSEQSPRKKEILLKQSFIWEQSANEDIVKAFLKNYEKSEGLMRRVETLYKKWKKEHPEEFKRYEIEKRIK